MLPVGQTTRALVWLRPSVNDRSTLERLRSDPPRLLPGGTGRFVDDAAQEEARAFLQARVAAFGGMLALVFGMFFVWRLASAFLIRDDPSRTYLPWQALTVLTFGGMWRICRGPARSFSFLRGVELAGLSVAASCAILMCSRISYAARPDTVLLLCLTYTLITRAIMIPSSARRTLLYGLVFAVPFLVTVYFIHLNRHDPAMYSATADPRLRLDAASLARRWTVVQGLWWTAATAISSATSSVIYGLRQEVRDARRLGQYTLSEKLGEGGMGVVYLARHALLRRASALKLLPPDRAGADSVARFEQEVQLTASLSHPNTIRVFDYGRTPDGIFYYVMEYLEGASLDEVVAHTGPLAPARVIHLLEQIAGALTEAHGVGLIHRDIKPANIFLTQLGGVPDVAKVLDFGLVKLLSKVSADAATADALTRDGSISGTPHYMAPEAITAPEQVDARTDLYALGAVAYYLLTGCEVFSGRNVLEVCSHHLHTAPEPPSKRGRGATPEDLETLVLACLQKDPARRPQSARDLQLQLRACVDAGRWDEDEARRWFQRFGPELGARRASLPVAATAVARTLAVDLTWHSGGQAPASND
jgi:eukaryotic-like serine/threonine-protein kinase